MTELGQTADPRALIPGSPEVVEADATALAQHGQRTEQVGQGLRRVDAGRWDGAAGSGFAETWAKEPVKWLKVADTISTTSAALTSYAGTLRWAQGQAGTAIQLWNQGEAEQAKETLARAREQLVAAGDQAARAIRGLPVGAPGAGVRSGGTLNDLVDTVTDGWTKSSTVTKNMPSAGVSASLSAGKKLAELKAFADAGGATWAGALRNGQFSASGTAGFDIAAKLDASASLGKNGLEAKVDASATAKVEAEGHADYGRVGLYARGSAEAGMAGSAEIKVGKNGVGAGLQGFAGLRAAVAGGADVGGIGVGAKAEGWVGAGIDAHVGFEKGPDGKYHLGASVGAALGIGGKVGLDLTVDPAQVEETAREAADAIGRGAQDVGHTVGAAAENVGHAVEGAAEGIGHVFGGIAKHLNPH